MTAYRYQSLGPLNAGEGSRAFLGLAITQDNRARPVVIIWMPEEAEKDRGLLEKIRREVDHAAQLDHPNIVTVFGLAKLEEGHARVVEFADGESLRRIIEVSRKLPPRIATRLVIDACTGTHYAHIAGNDDGVPLVHGDIRPETILISFAGVTKVTGYGALAFAPKEIGGQRVRGRRVHSSPEQIISGRNSISIPTDVYLLGITLYECLTGEVPWTDQAEHFDHAVLTLPLPSGQPGDLPEKLVPVLTKATAKKAQDRYQTPLALREAIEEAAGDDIASAGELAEFLTGLFPEANQLRAERRRVIDAGIADFVRRQWDNPAPPAPPQQPAAPAPVAPVPAAPAPVVPTPVAPAAPPPPPVAPAAKTTAPPRGDWTQAVDEPQPKGSYALPVALAAALAIGVFAWRIARDDAPVGYQLPKPVAVAVVDAGPAVVETPPQEEPVVDAGSEVATVVPEVVEAPEVDAGAPETPTPPDKVLVSIDSSPSADLLLDGVKLGKTPWRGQLPPGRKVFVLENKAQNFRAVRAVTVQDKPVDQTFTFGKGYVAVKAPEGAGIFIDGNRVATAPVRGEIPVYEGQHRIEVRIGNSKWNDSFSLYSGQRLAFNVELQ